jgi:hypothetical protein
MPLLHLLFITALCAAASLLHGDDDTALSQTDREFLTQAISFSTAEIRMARIAMHRHLLVPLQSLADTMVVSHSAALRQLLAWSRDKQAGVAEEIQPGDLMAVDALNGVSDGEVGERFVKMRIDWLRRSIDLFAIEIDDGNDIDLKEFAATAQAQARLDLDAAQVLEAQH